MKPASGMEMMLRSMGLGGIVEAAQTFISNGTIDKIVRFADSVEALENDRRKDRELLKAIAARCGITPDTDPGLFGDRTGDGEPVEQ
jgi:hypothetical protein